MKFPKILCTSVGNDGFPAVYEALKSKSNDYLIIGTDIRENAAGIYIADIGLIIRPRNEIGHIEEILSIIEKYEIDVFLPLSTEDQIFYAQQRKLIPVPVITSSLKSLRISNNKYKLFKFLEKHKCKFLPKFVKVNCLEELKIAVTSLGYPDKKVVIKLDEGTGSQGLKILDSQISGYERFLDRNNRNVTLDELLNWLADLKSFPKCHVVEYLQGDEYSVDLLCKSGKTFTSIVRKRSEIHYGLAIDAIVVKEIDVELVAKEIINTVGLSYVINVQLKKDHNGVPRLLEINPRIPGTIGLTVKAGSNLPHLAIEMALGKKIEIVEPIIGRRIIRYWEGVYINGDRKFNIL